MDDVSVRSIVASRASGKFPIRYCGHTSWRQQCSSVGRAPRCDAALLRFMIKFVSEMGCLEAAAAGRRPLWVGACWVSARSTLSPGLIARSALRRGSLMFWLFSFCIVHVCWRASAAASVPPLAQGRCTAQWTWLTPMAFSLDGNEPARMYIWPSVPTCMHV